MKNTGFLFLLVLFSISSFGAKRYNISKEEFINQFNESKYLNRVYCQNESGETIWLICNENTILNLVFDDDIIEKVMLQKTKLINDLIETIDYNVWWPSKKVANYSLEKVKKIYIERKFQEYERPYFNIDSVRNECERKNDSLKSYYNNRSEFYLLIIDDLENLEDSIYIIENACYNVTFRDGVITNYGVVNKITADSIFITNYFNSAMAIKNKSEFNLLKYSLDNLKSLSLLKSGGYGYNTIEIKERELLVDIRSIDISNMPYWFSFYDSDGKIRLYRLWLKENGYSGISEQNGRAVWYEGRR